MIDTGPQRQLPDNLLQEMQIHGPERLPPGLNLVH